MHFHNGMTGAQMHNLLPVLYDRATRQAIDAYERDPPGPPDLLLHARRLQRHAGRRGLRERRTSRGTRPPTGRAPPAWPSQTTDMLNRAIGGAYGFSTDIGGYFDLGPYQADHKGALPTVGGVGRAVPAVPSSWLAARRDPHPVELRRSDGAGSMSSWSRFTSPPGR